MKITYKLNSSLKILLIIVISCTFILPGSAINADLFKEELNKINHNNGKLNGIIYVDDNNTAGPWDGTIDHPYQYIQDGIDYANPDGTVFVFEGYYFENILIDKTIELIGENNDLTIIDGSGNENVVRITADHIVIRGFSMINSSNNPNNAGIKMTSDNNTITDNIIENNFHGLILKQSSDNNEISNNIIRNNKWNGLYILSTCGMNDGNLIFENRFENNSYSGIAVEDSSYNYIYHNNFYENTHNAYDNSNNIWDNGYPSGGNFWDDYQGFDELNGADQDQPGPDGIGDIPYNIPDGINKDCYPLIEPFGGEDTTPPTVDIVSPENGLYFRNIRLLPLIFRQKTIIIGAVEIQVQATDIQTGIQKVEFYLNDDPNPISTDYNEPYSWNWNTITFLKHKNNVYVVAYDNVGNYNIDMITVRKYL